MALWAIGDRTTSYPSSTVPPPISLIEELADLAGKIVQTAKHVREAQALLPLRAQPMTK